MYNDLNNCIQLTNTTKQNFNIYFDPSKNICYSIATETAKNDGCKNSTFGNFKYFISTIYNYKSYSQNELTVDGLQLVKQYVSDYKLTVEKFFSEAGRKLAKI